MRPASANLVRVVGTDVITEEPYALIGHVRFCEGEACDNLSHVLSTRLPSPSRHQGGIRTGVEFHAVASGSDERIVAVHDRKASAGLRQTGLSTLLPRLRFPLGQTRLIRRYLSVCRLDGGSAKVGE